MRSAFDYIIVGAGSAGCILAARLSEQADVQVLLLEAGGADTHPIIAMPAALPYTYQSQRLGWGYTSGPEPHLAGRSIDEKRGKVLGGTSSINAMIFNRGNPLDFEGWAASGLPEWDYAHCLPYFRQMETFEEGGNDWRGGRGPLHISRCRARHKFYDAFLRGGEQAGFALTPDHNGYQQEGLHIAQAFVHRGERVTSARAWLRPARHRANLHIRLRAQVRRVLIENGAAHGVELLDGSLLRAEREVILCAGAFNSPQLLMLSGVGAPDALRALAIAVQAEAPQVGQNLENHPGVNLQYASAPQDSLTAELGLLGRARMGAQWLLTRRGLGASNFFEAGAFLRTREDVAFPNMQFEFLPLARRVQHGKLVAIPGFQFWMDLSRPESRGAVTLRSNNPADAPSIVFNHLAARQDLQDMVDGVRLARRLVQQAAWDKYRGREITPGAQAQSQAELEAFVRANLGSSYHPSGTCRMGADDAAVVDSAARVKTVANLRVIDASILPRSVTANLSASIMMMAEKLADAIAGKPPLTPSGAAWYRFP